MTFEATAAQAFAERDELLRRLANAEMALIEAPASETEDIWQIMEDVFKFLGHEDAGELLAQAVESGQLSIEQVADVLNCGMWAGKTNGADLKPTLDRWLRQGTDLTRVKIALAQDIYSLDAGPEMRVMLLYLAQKWPELAPRCQIFLD